MSSSEMDPIASKLSSCSESQESQEIETDPLKSLKKHFEGIEALLEELIEQTQRNKRTVNSTDGRGNNFVNTIGAISNECDIDVPIRIFKIPDSLTSVKPEAYVPQIIGLGPIHHLRPEVQHMQMYKAMEAIRIHKELGNTVEFEELIEFLKNNQTALLVRASCNIYLDMEDDVLACVMAVDGLFLFSLLCCYGISEEAPDNSTSLCHLAKSSEKKRLAQDKAIQVAMMLENQIPICVLKVILIVECWSDYQNNKTIARVRFPEILLRFCECFSPLKIVENYPLYMTLCHAHLLDLLYHLVTLKQSPKKNPMEEENEFNLLDRIHEDAEYPLEPSEEYQMDAPEMDVPETAALITAAPVGMMGAANQIIQLVHGLLGLPWSQTKSSIVSALKKEVPEKEVFIPRAWKLQKAGVKFEVTARITDIKFEPNEVSFCLPVITINASSEVIIRNLVVYEAMIMSGTEAPILNWYVELMNGLIQTAEDVRVLKGKGILIPESIDDEQVVEIFSGMNKVVELRNIPDNLNDAVGDVKKYYNHVWWVSKFKFMNRCWRTTRKWYPVIASLLALFLLAAQTICSVYGCSRFSFKTSNTPQAHQGMPLPNSLRSHLM